MINEIEVPSLDEFKATFINILEPYGHFDKSKRDIVSQTRRAFDFEWSRQQNQQIEIHDCDELILFRIFFEFTFDRDGFRSNNSFNYECRLLEREIRQTFSQYGGVTFVDCIEGENTPCATDIKMNCFATGYVMNSVVTY